MSLTSGINLAPLRTELRVDIEGFKSNLERAKAIGTAKAKEISKSLEGVTKVGEALTKAGDKLTKFLTVPLAGAGVAATKMALQFGDSFAKVSTLLDEGQVNVEEYRKSIIKASSDTKVSVDDFAEAVYQSISASIDQKDAIEFTTQAVKLAKGGFTDTAKAVDVLTTAINAYGLSAEDSTRISDLLITTQNLGKTTVDELSESMGRVIPVAKNMNFSIDELSASYALLTKNGIATNEAGTYLKSMLNELGKSGSTADKALRELAGKGFAELKKEGKPTTEILKMLDEYAKANEMSLSDMFGSVEAGTAAMTLARGEGKEYNDILKQMEGCAGATQKAFDKMDATPAEKLRGALNKLKNAAIDMGEKLVPWVEKAADKISELADAFGNLSDEQQGNILKWAGVAMAVGPVLKITGTALTTFVKLKTLIGGLTSGISAAAGGFSGFMAVLGPLIPVIAGAGAAIYVGHEYTELLNSSIDRSREEMSLTERVLADLTGQTTYTREELEKMGLVQKELSGELSGEFKNAVIDSTKDIQEFEFWLHQITLDDVITAEEGTELGERVNTACEKAIEAVNNKSSSIQETLMEAFKVDGVIDHNEQTLLNFYENRAVKEKAEVQEKQEAINELLRKVREEGYTLTPQDEDMIKQYYNDIKQIELEAQANNEYEYQYAKNEFRARAKTLDSEAAQELLNERKQQLDEQITQTDAFYQTSIDMVMQHYDEMSNTEKMAADAEVDRLYAEWGQKKQILNTQYAEDYQYCVEHNENLVDVLNKYNQEKLSRTDLAFRDQFKLVKDSYAGMDEITKSGMYKLYNTATDAWDKVVVTVDNATGDVVGLCQMQEDKYGMTAGEVYSYCESMQKDISDLALDTQSKMSIFGGYFDGAAQVLVDANGIMVNSLNGTEVQLKNVTDAGGGLRQGILEINGTPVKVLFNKDGAVQNANEIKRAIDNIPRTVSVSVTYWEQRRSRSASAVYEGYHANGLDYVPYDGYYARLHKGERVLTERENEEYTKNVNNINRGVTLQIDNFINNREEDIEDLADRLNDYLERRA